MKLRPREGFTLVELLVVVVLGGLLVLTVYQLLITNTRTYAVNNAQIQGQQTLRAGTDILFGELREISTPGGDLLAMGPDSVTVRAQRAFGVVCTVDYSASPPELTVFRIGPVFQAGDSIFVFHDNDVDRSSDDEWFSGTATSVDTNAFCGASAAQIIGASFLASVANATPPDSVRVGAPVRAYDVYTYGLYELDGESYLGRRLRGATDPDPLVGPLVPERGVTFRYLDDQGAVTAVSTDVAQIEVTLRYSSEMRNFQNVPVSDSMVVRIYPRN